jgi:NAD(P)-dependent dehydrogenase (short-subunit alcohol dehydrogenase family)
MAEGLLQGKVAVVTGAGRGIGRAIALLMARHGARVVVNDLGVALDGTGPARRPAEEVVAEIRAEGGAAVASYDTVATMQGGESIIRAALDAYSRLDILVNPAGILRDRMVFNMTEEEWDAVIAVHLKGHFSLIKPASVLMRQQRSGRIIAFTSTSGLWGNSGQANYGAAKDGVAGLVRVVARDLGRYGVTTNAISPSAETRMTATVPETTRDLRAQRGIAAASGAVPRSLPRPPEAIAHVAVWLASDEAAEVNGQVFWVSGGMVGLMSQPTPGHTITKGSGGRWSVEELAAVFPTTLGMDLVNPAPPAPPAQPG